MQTRKFQYPKLFYLRVAVLIIGNIWNQPNLNIRAFIGPEIE